MSFPPTRPPMLRFGLLAAILAGSGSGPAPASATLAFQASQPSDIVERSPLRELAERLLSVPVRHPSGYFETQRLLPEAVPDDLPLDPRSLLPGARLVGTALRLADDVPIGANIIFVVPGDADPVDLVRYASAEITRQGWSEPPISARPFSGGFEGPRGIVTISFCQTVDGPQLELTIYPSPDRPTEARVRLQMDQPIACGRQSSPPGSPGSVLPTMDVIPRLSLPPGVRSEVGSAPTLIPTTLSRNRVTSEVTAITGMSAADLEAYVSTQLQTAGWVRLNGRDDGPLAWSLWQVPGESGWRGLVLALETGDDRRSLILRMESPTPAGPPVIDLEPIPRPPPPPLPQR